MYYDREFLKQLDNHRTKITYARIIALSLDETPIEAIEGRVTEGSINIDGDSSVRRTCSLTIVAKDFDYNEFIWGLNTKIKIEIGLENVIDARYPSIIWFKQGTYFISSFNTSHSTNNFTISLQGKDKMCALNGELGGTLTSSVDFGTVEDIITLESGEKMTKITKLTLKEIIRNLVHLYGGEPLHNIIINDLDISGLELLEYRYDEDTPLYLYGDAVTEGFLIANITLDGNKTCQIKKNKENQWYSYIDKQGKLYQDEPDNKPTGFRAIVLNDLKTEDLRILITPLTGKKEHSTIKIDGYDFYVSKITFGETAGYRYTDLTYPGDLIGAVGESLTSILDKIKGMLGEYEYFYDLDGRFIFQRKQYSFESTFSPLDENEEGEQIIDFENNIAYTFNDGALITTFNNNPDLSNLKNDYSVWGTRQSLSGASIPVHMRYAIDKKPIYYKTLDGQVFTSDGYDWRELIYQMAKDYYANTNNDNFESQLAAANIEYYPTGKTGYESYYADLMGFWRNLYNPAPDNYTYKTRDYYPKDHTYEYWNKTVYEAPQNLNFWFDFLDTEGTMSQYSISNIGCRPKAVNDSNVKAIYFREIPDVIFTSNYDEDKQRGQAYTYISIPETLMKTMFSISAQGKSAKTEIDDLLYKYSYCIASTTINTIPIYYLEPNAKIHVVDQDTKLDGYYKVSKLSIPLTYNGTMSITATKAAEHI